MVRVPTLLTALLLGVFATSALASADDDPWKPLRPLIGEWSGEGSGEPGAGEGRFSFALDLQDKVLVRRHHAEVRGSGNRSTTPHDDLMVIYQEGATRRIRAIYFDSEGHVINYTASLSADGKNLTLVSDLLQGAPRFRLTYAQTGSDTLNIKFEIAQPGRPEEYRTYLEGKARRKEKSSSEKDKDKDRDKEKENKDR